MDGTDGARSRGDEGIHIIGFGGGMFTPSRRSVGMAADLYQEAKLHDQSSVLTADLSPIGTVVKLMLAGFALLFLLPSACFGEDVSISADMVHVIELDTQHIVLSSAKSVARVDVERGPIRVRAKFSDSGGKFETRIFASDYVVLVEPVKAGTAEILLIPLGIQSIDEMQRFWLTVTDGTNPKPPPEPGPEPKPIPPGPTPPKGIRVLLLADESASREQLNTINSTQVIAWLNSNCATSVDGRPEWRRWDPTSIRKTGMLDAETEVWKRLWSDVSPSLPAGNVVVVAADNRVTIEPLKGPTETLALLNRIKAGGQ